MSTWDGYNKQIYANRFQKTFVINHIDVSGRMFVRQDASLNSRLFVINDASFSGNVFVNGNLITNSKFIINGDASLNNRLFVMNDASFMSNVYVNRSITANSKFIVNGNVSAQYLNVLNDASFMSNIYISGNIIARPGFTLNSSNIFINNNVYVSKDISCNGNISIGRDLIVLGNLAVKNYTNQNIINTTTTNYQLVVAEDISLNGRLAISSDTSLNGNLYVNNNIGIRVAQPLGLLDVSGSLVRNTLLITGNLGIGGTTASSSSDTGYPPLYVSAGVQRNGGFTYPNINGLTIENTNNTSSTAHSMLLVKSGGSGGGNPYVSYDVAGEGGWSHGIFNSTSNFNIADEWKLTSTNSVLSMKNGTNFVGIGTSNPSAFLNIYGSGALTKYSNAPDLAPGTAAYHNMFLGVASSSTYNFGMTLGVDASNMSIGYINVAAPGAYRPLCLQTQGGNVGIGKTNPLEKLDISGGLKVGGGSSITGIDAGQAGLNVGSGTVNFNITFPTNPVVFTTIRASSTNQVFAVHVGTVSTTTFAYTKTWKHTTTAANGGSATAETFNWVAISFS